MPKLYAGVEETKDDFGPLDNHGGDNIIPNGNSMMENKHHLGGGTNAHNHTGTGTLPQSHAYDTHESPCDASSVLESITKVFFGSCGNVVEAASFFVQSSFQRSTEPKPPDVVPNDENIAAVHGKGRHPQAQRNRKIDPLARIAGRYQSKSLNPRSEAPRQAAHNGAAANNQHINNNHVIQNTQAPAHTTTEIPSFLAGETVTYSFDDNISALSAHTLEEMAKKDKDNSSTSPLKVQSDLSSLHPPSPTRTASSSSSSHGPQSHHNYGANTGEAGGNSTASAGATAVSSKHSSKQNSIRTAKRGSAANKPQANLVSSNVTDKLPISGFEI